MNQTSTLNQKLFIILILLIPLMSCQNLIDTPSLSCPSMKMMVNIGETTRVMNFVSNVIFNQHTDSGGIKFMSTEATCDSFKVLLNLRDTLYTDLELTNDSLHLRTYEFMKGVKNDGLVIIAIATPQGYKFLETDTSSITIRRINTKNQTVTGFFYLETGNKAKVATGTFENTCYVRLE
ncbi:hypothetical protein DVR12_09700 [Chitinophaga silvatica]|uniref:Uncharacterized protein n=2 Tax=Chitinophaga silvatica TaxID=2282649 RepID=A0A3E1YBV5_9BACT|nr:hypothetical protein DVR12_09700 [Chitinophaga silvatica]